MVGWFLATFTAHQFNDYLGMDGWIDEWMDGEKPNESMCCISGVKFVAVKGQKAKWPQNTTVLSAIRRKG